MSGRSRVSLAIGIAVALAILFGPFLLLYAVFILGGTGPA